MRNPRSGLDLDPTTMARLRALAAERERDEDEARFQHHLRTGETFDRSEVAAWLDSLGTDKPLPPLHRLG